MLQTIFFWKQETERQAQSFGKWFLDRKKNEEEKKTVVQLLLLRFELSMDHMASQRSPLWATRRLVACRGGNIYHIGTHCWIKCFVQSHTSLLTANKMILPFLTTAERRQVQIHNIKRVGRHDFSEQFLNVTVALFHFANITIRSWMEKGSKGLFESYTALTSQAVPSWTKRVGDVVSGVMIYLSSDC